MSCKPINIDNQPVKTKAVPILCIWPDVLSQGNCMIIDFKYDLEITVCITGTNLEILLGQTASLPWFRYSETQGVFVTRAASQHR